MSEVTREDRAGLKARLLERRPAPFSAKVNQTMHEAADCITALQAELAEARARIAVLEEALETIVDHCANAGLPNEIVSDRVVDRCDATARQALTGKEAP
jgi:hypothetical protein